MNSQKETEKERDKYCTLDNQKQVILQNKSYKTYNWYRMVVFPALSSPTIITLCSVKRKRIIWTTIFVISLLTEYYGQFTIYVECVLHFGPGFGKYLQNQQS